MFAGFKADAANQTREGTMPNPPAIVMGEMLSHAGK